MLRETALTGQLSGAEGDRVRVLIVGAGIAGLTLAQLLRRQGLHPVLIDRAGADAPSGYMLALMPLVDPVLADLGVSGEYVARSTALRRYRIRDRHGYPIRETSMAALLNSRADYRGIGRGELMAALASQGGPVTHGTTVTGLEQRLGGTVAALSEGGAATEAEFDVIVAADGLHSKTRGLILRPEQVTTYDTGWGGWVVWADPDADQDLGEELWGSGSFVGTYPVKDAIGAIVCAPGSAAGSGLEAFVDQIRTTIPSAGDRMDRVLTEAVDGRKHYYWPLTDCRASTWSQGRVVLLGDAAAGFLPTAGIGAGMAMESAWVLAGRLAQCEREQAPAVLAAFEREQRPELRQPRRIHANWRR